MDIIMENNYLCLYIVLLDSFGEPSACACIPILPFADSTYLFEVAKRRFDSLFSGYDWYMYLCPKDAREWKFTTNKEMTNFLTLSCKIHAFHYVVDALMSKDFQKSPYMHKRVRASQRTKSVNNNSLF